MKYLITRVKVTEKEGFDIYFEAYPEYESLKDMLPEDTEEEIQEIYNTCDIFVAKVIAEKHGIELGYNYLGGCIYESMEDFYTKYKDDYFADMVDTAISEAKETINKLKQ